MKLAEEYPKAKDIEERIAILQHHYDLTNVKIHGEVKPGFLGLGGVGGLKKHGDIYKIEVIGKHAEDYITLHEFLHIWLKETLKDFKISEEDPDLERYLYNLRNLFNDYLIETEVIRQFKNHYEFTVNDIKSNELIGIFTGGNPLASSLDKFMFAFTCKALSELYPSMKEGVCGKFIGEGIQWPGLNVFLAALSQSNSEISPREYWARVIALHRALTNSYMSYKEGAMVIENPSAVKSLINDFKRLEDNIGAALRLYCMPETPDKKH